MARAASSIRTGCPSPILLNSCVADFSGGLEGSEHINGGWIVELVG